MKRTHYVAGCLLFVFSGAFARPDSGQGTPPPDRADPFKVVSTITAAGQELTFTVYFVGKSVVEFEDGTDSKPTVVYDLGSDSWRDISPPRVVKLSDCEAWAKASAERTRASITKVDDPQLRRFIEGMLDPKFEVTAEKGRLRMASDMLVYDIRSKQSPPKAQRDLLYAYDRLNAYRKAMLERQQLPFAQLAVTKELAARELVPNEITLEVNNPQGKVRIQVTMEVQPLTPQERGRVEAVVAGRSVP